MKKRVNKKIPWSKTDNLQRHLYGIRDAMNLGNGMLTDISWHWNLGEGIDRTDVRINFTGHVSAGMAKRGNRGSR